jgi:hypothetical protein
MTTEGRGPDMDHARFEDDVGAYALRALEEGEMAAFERHLAGCALCREQLDATRLAADALARSVEPFEAPASLKRSLMSAVREEAQASPPPLGDRARAWLGGLFSGARPQLAWVSAGFVLAVGVALGYAAFQGSEGDDSRTVTASVDRSRLAQGSARLIVPEDEGEGAVLDVSGVPQPGRGEIYMVWLKRGQSVSPAGSYFAVDAQGRGTTAIRDDLRDVDAVMVSREKQRKLPGQPTEPPVITARV